MNRTILSSVLGAAVSAPALAQDWMDNFGDGDASDGQPVLWTASPAFGAAFEVVNGDLLVTMDPGSPAISSPRVGNYFPDGASVRARMIAPNGPGRYTVAFADEPTGIQGYVASLSTCGGGRIELFRGDVLGSIIILGIVPWSYGPDEEFIVQLDVFDGIVSARVWRPGEPFPEAQIEAPDATYADGVASIAIQDFGTNPCGGPGILTDATATVRYMQASSTPLTHSSAADFNADGLQNIFDIQGFLDAYFAAGAAADLNEDGVLDFFDVLVFLSRWDSGHS